MERERCGNRKTEYVWEECICLQRGIIVKYRKLGDLRNRNLFLTVLEAVKILAGLVSSKASLLGLLMATFSLYPFCFACASLVSLHVFKFPLLIKISVNRE